MFFCGAGAGIPIGGSNRHFAISVANEVVAHACVGDNINADFPIGVGKLVTQKSIRANSEVEFSGGSGWFATHALVNDERIARAERHRLCVYSVRVAKLLYGEVKTCGG